MSPQDNEPSFHLINEKKPSNKRKIILTIVSFVVAVALAAVTYLWWQEKETSRSLKTQLDTAKQESQRKSTTTSNLLAPTQAKYSAVVGKFSLTMAEKYFIIIDLDGEFEGGPATRLAVGTRNGTGEQTINSATHARVTVDAYPIASSTYANRVTQETADYPDKKKLANIPVSGVDAEVYELPGLFTDKKLFFTKNDIVYVITAHSSEAVQAVLDDVIAGFKFTN